MADTNILDRSMTSYAGTPLFNIVYIQEYTGYPAWRVFDNIQSGRALLSGDNGALLTSNYYGLTTKQNKTYFNSLLINKTLNFAFLLPTNSNYVDTIHYTADLKGSWAKSKHKLEYDYSLINTKIYFNTFIPSVIKITY